MKIQKTYFTLVALLTITLANAQAQPRAGNFNDHLFATKGKSMITIATGIPYIGIAEYAYGFSDRFSLGIIFGRTPKVPGYGIRVRYILHKRESFRIFLRAPLFYYPQTKGLGGEPWLLTWPAVSAEWKLKSGIRLSLGGGFVAAACANDLMSLATGGEDMHSHDDPGHSEAASHMQEGGFMGGFWNTFHAGIAVPVGKRLTLHTEASIVRNGLKKARKDWVGVIPVIVVLGFSYSI